MNAIHVGLNNSIELPAGACLLIDDEIREIPDWRRPRVFDPRENHFNFLDSIDYRQAREDAEAFYAASPQGSDTLTQRNGKRTLAKLFLRDFRRLDKIEKHLWKKAADKEMTPAEGEALGAISDVLLSPVLRRMLCNKANFTFNENCVIQARINRKELGEFDALMLGLLLMSHYKAYVSR